MTPLRGLDRSARLPAHRPPGLRGRPLPTGPGHAIRPAAHSRFRPSSSPPPSAPSQSPLKVLSPPHPPPPSPPSPSSSSRPFALGPKEMAQLCERNVTDHSCYGLGLVSGPEDLAAKLRTSVSEGLDVSDAVAMQVRYATFGRNAVAPPPPVSFLALVMDALSDFTIMILVASGVLSLGLELVVNKSDPSGWIEGAAILVAVAVCVLVTATNNYQKESQFRELNAVKDDVEVKVVRGGRTEAVSCKELTVGDLLLIETGDILTVDCILVSCSALAVDESHLTGESEDIRKDPATNPVLYSGSKIMQGVGRALVVAVGENSQVGLLTKLMTGGGEGPAAASQSSSSQNGLRKQTVLAGKLEKLAEDIGRFGLGAAALSLGVMASKFTYSTFVVQGLPWDWAYLSDYLHFLITSITILVVAVPEGLPLAVTLSLAFSVKQMLKENNLVRHLDACETMGSATTICSDKTGTLTANKMTVVRCWAGQRLYANVVNPSQSALSALASVLGSSGSMGSIDCDTIPTHKSESGSSQQTAPLARPHRAKHMSSWETEIPAPLKQLIVQGFVANSTVSEVADPVSGATTFQGNRTEVALLNFAMSVGLGLGQGEQYAALRADRPVVQVFPFSSERKQMTVVTASATASDPSSAIRGGFRSFTKGAVEVVLLHCTLMLAPNGDRIPVDDATRVRIATACENDDLRVLALAYKDLDGEPAAEAQGEGPRTFEESDLTSGLTLICLVGLEDPLRPEVPSAIAKCQRAGIVVRMLTGDNHVTASAIAAKCGILPTLEDIRGLEAAEHSGFTDSSADSDLLRDGTIWDLVPGLVQRAVGPSLAYGRGRGSGALSSSESEDREEMRGTSSLGNRWGLEVTWQARLGPLGAFSADPDSGPSGSSTSLASDSADIDDVPSPVPRAPSAAAASLNGAPHPSGQRPQLLSAIEEYRSRGLLIEGPEFRARVTRADGSFDAAAFADLWPNLRVVARCSPADKFLLVQGLKASQRHEATLAAAAEAARARAGERVSTSASDAVSTSRDPRHVQAPRRRQRRQVVAVTGDGSNDAPALAAADVGFAMCSGTTVAKEASDIVLMDDNFNSIVSAVKWGRNVYENITRFLQFQLTVNCVAILTACGGALFLETSPLTAVQMLWVNLIMDSLASLALATERPTDALLNHPPRDAEESLLQPTLLKHMAGQVVYQLVVMFFLVTRGPEIAGAAPGDYTLAFNAFVFAQLFNQISCRKIHNEANVLEGLFENPLFVGILGGEVCFQALIVQYGGAWFHTTPLNARQWAISLGVGVGSLAVHSLMQRVRILTSESGYGGDGDARGLFGSRLKIKLRD